jgi:PfaB family protein
MTSSQEKIAIIGMSCLFPGAADPDAFWQNLIEARNTTSQATADQFGVDPAIYFDPQRTHHDTTYFLRGGYIQTPVQIDNEFIKTLDRVYQWSYYVVSEALRDAGYQPQADDLSRCGLLLGNLSFPTRMSHALLAAHYDKELSGILEQLLNQDIELQHPGTDSEIDPWNVYTFGGPGALISKLLGLNSVHFTLDAACGASLYTVGLACEYLLSGKADLMLAGAVNAADPLFVNMGFTQFGAYPSSGDSRPLDATSGGLVAGEGAAMFLLKRHSDAVRDGDHIHAVIAGIGLANDGRGKHALTPNPRGQLLALQRAYASGEVDPASVQYVECHASGTPLGDKTEIGSLDEFFGGRAHAPAIGSVKSNLGHLLTVAGMASMLKVILSMKHNLLPATLGIEQPMTLNSSTLTANSIIQANTPWTAEPKIAGVNAFGFGGVSSHVVLTDKLPQSESLETSTQTANQVNMAIVGMDLHFSDVDNLDDFTETIFEGRQHFRPLPPKRWRGLYDDQAPVGAYIESFDIDYMRFKFPPKEDEQPIAQQLLLLKVADGAIRDAGLHEGDNVAVIVAMETELGLHQYRERLDLSWQIRDALNNAKLNFSESQTNALRDAVKDAVSPRAQVNQYTSAIGNIASSRVSAHWNFSGPAFSLSALENSVFAALEISQLLLRDTALDAVVVGAIDLAGGVEAVLSRSQQHPTDTRETPTMSFDQASTGWNIGEGAGAVVLKRTDRIRPNERVYAVVDGIALVSEVGETNVVQQAVDAALSAAAVQPDDIGYVEAHASGFADQDSIEMQGLTRVYKIGGSPITALGSVKANLGHSFTASGMASLIKTVLCLYNRMLPTTPNWNKPKTDAEWQNGQFYVPDSSRTWVTRADQPRRAAISSLAMDGSAAHVILTEGSHNPEHRYLQSRSPKLLLIDADTKPGLLGRLGQLETAIADGTQLSTLATRAFNVYQNKPLVLALVAKDLASLRKEIDAAKSALAAVIDQGGEWQTPAGSYFTAKPLGKGGGVAFVYPGAFNSYPGLGQDWMHLFPEAYDHLLTLTDNPPATLADDSLYQRSLETPDRASVRAFRAGLQDNPIAMMASGTTFSVLYTQVLRDTFQVKPQTAFGYSLGEGSMFWSLGVWKDADTANERFRSSDLFNTRLFGRKQAVREAWSLPETTPDDFWESYVLVAPSSDVARVLERESRVYITHINTPNETVIAGDSAACKRVIQQLNVSSVKAPFEVVIHNDAMLSEFDAFYRLHDNPVNAVSGIQFYSAADYAPVALTSDSIARSMARMICKPVDFPRLVRRAYENGSRIFIELGPGSTCTRWIHETLGKEAHLAVSIDNLRADDYTGLIKLLARLASHRVPMNFSSLFASAAEEVPASGRNSIKTVTLGGERIADMLLTAENRQRFGTAQTLTTAPVETKTSATVVRETMVAPVMLAAPASAINSSTTSTSMNTRLASLRDFESEIRQKLSERQAIKPVQAAQPAITAPASPLPVEITKLPTMPPAVNRFEPGPALFDTERIDQFARGRIANCFGEEYAIYDNQRAPRIPNTDLMFVSRAVEIGAERLVTKSGSTLVMEYDVPTDIWFYRDNSAPFTPYSVLMEMALQPCGFLSAYMGPTLAYPEIDFYFRNLDGAATLHREVDLRGRTLTNRVELLSSTTLQGIIIQKYSFEMILDGQPFFVGSSTFGYFTLQALSSQAGLDMGKPPARWHEAHPDVKLTSVAGDRGTTTTRPAGLELPHGQLAFLDAAQIAINGGAHGQGYIWGTSKVSPSDWFFRCHFHQDPVMPGSLGLETITQAVQAYAIEAGLDKGFTNPRFGQVENHEVTWKYRGQVLSDSEQINVEVSIKSVERQGEHLAIIADASLWKGALRIYQFNNVAVAIVEGSEG